MAASPGVAHRLTVMTDDGPRTTVGRVGCDEGVDGSPPAAVTGDGDGGFLAMTGKSQAISG
ncbi:MAG TPA: hypothetical protein VH023_13735 [Rhodopila sp.]|jgi:hypothetical protein|nr:hypothetical protein [Rhodopila sp.]